MLISEPYRALCAELHKNEAVWGAFLCNWVLESLKILGAISVLDYGCGKGALKQSYNLAQVRNYDPAIPGLENNNTPADVVVCRVTLEHIEPECLDAVLDDIKRCAVRYVVIKITTVPSDIFLPDGRNTHLILEDQNWWLERLLPRWTLLYAEQMERGLRFIGKTKK